MRRTTFRRGSQLRGDGQPRGPVRGEAGRLAAEQGSLQDIKDQGATEAHDHQPVGDKLKSTATATGLTVADTLDIPFQQKPDFVKA